MYQQFFFVQRPGAPRPVSNEFVSMVVNSLHQGLGNGGGGAQGNSGGSVSSGASAGKSTTPGYPANATQNEIKIWDNTVRAFNNEEVCICTQQIVQQR